MPLTSKPTADDSVSAASMPSRFLAAFLSELQERVSAFKGRIGEDELALAILTELETHISNMGSILKSQRM
jgi:hypothetical protein